MRRKARHVRALAEAVDLALLANLQRRRAVGVGGDEIAAEIGEGLGGGGFLGRIEPGIDHHQLGGDLRVDRLRRQGERVHPHHDFGDLERTEIADHPCLRHASGDRADHRSALIEALVVKADVVGLLVTGAMLELGVRQLLGGLDRLVHEAEGRGEDQLVALLREVLDDRDGACVFLHILDVARDDLTLQRLVHREPALVVRPAPAIVADRPRIDEAELQRFGGEARVG